MNETKFFNKILNQLRESKYSLGLLRVDSINGDLISYTTIIDMDKPQAYNIHHWKGYSEALYKEFKDSKLITKKEWNNRIKRLKNKMKKVHFGDMKDLDNAIVK